MMKLIISLLALIITSTVPAQLKPVGSGVFNFNDAPVKKDSLRETRKFLEGTTYEFDFFKAHATTQQKGAAPKPAHAQKDIEELIIIKEGSMKCNIGDKTATLSAGSVLLIPPTVMQQFENAGNGPLTYYVFQFRSKKGIDLERSNKAGGIILKNIDTLVYTEKDGKGARKYFDRATAATERFEMHTTTLKNQGPSHAPHQHIETEIILITEGEAEMTIDGTTYKAKPGDFIIAASNTLHGVANASTARCTYYAFKWK
jgi:mannose-6-phosphate isomerase-like protein (cupin superfamily)